MADWKSGGNAKKPGWRGDNAPASKATARGWKATAEKPPGSGLRKVGAVITGLLLLGVTGAIIWWVLLPKPAPKPCLVLLAANPADHCTKLDVPLDLFGWQSAKFLAEQAKDRAAKEQAGTWGTFAPHVALASDGNPMALPTTEQELGDWANSVRNFDPLVIYVGAHAGTGGDGPFLFANGRNRLPLKVFLATLATDPLRDKKKVLLLDPGRLTPSVHNGQLVDDFAVQLKTFNKQINECPNLLVMVGSDAGERGWESEEMLATPLALALNEALNGAETVSTDDDLITGMELFTYLKKRVTEWTRENRPTMSTPYLLPEGPDGESRAKAITVAVKPSAPASARTPVTTLDYAELDRAWKRHDELAKSQPAPHTYSPRLWRRYRELLLRYEAAQRAGDVATIKKLRAALDASDEVLKSRALPTFDSAVNSTALQMALGLKPADVSKIPIEWQSDAPMTPPPTDPAVRLAILDAVMNRLQPDDKATPAENTRRLRNAGTLQLLYEPDQRPVEAHYAVMARDFHDKLGPDDVLPKELFAAARLRSAFEFAALGSGLNEKATGLTVYPELLGTRLKSATAELDALRRTAEDALFATDPASQAEAKKALDAATERLAKLNSQSYRNAMQLRDRVLADSPYACEWRLTNDALKVPDLDNSALWAGIHETVLKLDGDDAQVTAVVKSLDAADEKNWKQFQSQLQEAIQSAIAAQDQNATLQGQWQPKQYLLATPLVPAEQRVAMLKASRDISAKLLAGAGKQTGNIESDKSSTQSTKAYRRGALAFDSLGRALIEAQCQQNASLPKFVEIEAALLKLTTNVEGANSVGAMLAAHFQELAKPVPPSAVVNPAAERASRLAWAYDADETLEPAAVNQRLRWQQLLTAFGERACADRWYDEKEQPYFSKLAERYFRDAAAVVKDLPVPKLTDAETKRRTDLLANRKLQVAATPETLNWTSELKRSVSFGLTVSADYPAAGQAVAIRGFSKSAPLKASDAAQAGERPLLDVAAGKTLSFASLLDVGVAERLDATCSTAGSIYFRGQRPTAELPINVMRRPELVLADPLPKATEKDLGIAVRAAPDLDLGEIVIVIDYSGSMREGLKDGEYFENDYRSKPSKFRFALDALKPVLSDLPLNTRLKIRVFSDKTANGDFSRIVFGDFDKDRTKWQKGNEKPLTDLMELLESLNPRSFTPLVKSILDAAGDFSKDASRTKTIVVLTDGADQTPEVESTVALMERRSGELYAKFKDSDIQLLVVTFGLRGEDVKLSKVLFDGLKTHKNPGQVWNSANQDKLRENLRDALRPKLKLADAGGTPAGYPRSGWPARLRDDGKDDRETLYWSPSLKVPQNLRLTATPYPSADHVDKELRVEEGDRLLLELAKVDGRTVVRRDLYSDFFGEDKKKTRGDKQWVLTVPTTTVDDRREPLSLRGLALLEKTPPHRYGGADAATLQLNRPEFLWWDIAPAIEGGAKAPTGTVTIRKLYTYAAPAWDLKAENWPREGAVFASPQLKAFVRDTQPPTKTITLPVGDAVQKATTADGDEIELRPAIEEHAIGPNGETISCLVVRVVHQPGKPVMLRLVSPSIKHNAEQRYYRKADAVTAIFGPLTADDLRAQAPKLDLIAVTPVTADAAASIVFTAPRPTPGVSLEQKYIPVLATPVENR